MTDFNTMMEMELRILNGQNTDLLNYLLNNSSFSEAYYQYILASINGENKSVRELIGKVVEVFENEFGVKAKSIQEMEKLIRERTGCDVENSINAEDIPIFTPPDANEDLLRTAIEATEGHVTTGTMKLQLQMIEQVSNSPEQGLQEQVENDLIG